MISLFFKVSSLKFLIILSFCQLYGEISLQTLKDPQNKTAIVSLGSNCRVSTWLKELDIRSQAFPFDWVECEEIEGLISLIENDFNNYLLFENLIPFFKDYFNRVRDKVYKINLVHDFSFQGNELFSWSKKANFKIGMSCLKKEYPHVYAKYKRRIARLKSLPETYETVIFVRVFDSDKNSAQRLYDALQKMFKQSIKITLIVIGDTDDYKQDWELSGIKNFWLPTLYLIHDGHGIEFINLLQKL